MSQKRVQLGVMMEGIFHPLLVGSRAERKGSNSRYGFLEKYNSADLDDSPTENRERQIGGEDSKKMGASSTCIGCLSFAK